MRHSIWSSLLATVGSALLLGNVAAQTPAPSGDNYADTWAAIDALGRALPGNAQTGAPKQDKFVGVFYFLWLEDNMPGPFDITKIRAQDPDVMTKPDSPLWGPELKFHHWSEPLFGFYTMSDEWVLRKHAQMLADAGVDTVIFDVTNQETYPASYMKLCQVWSQVRAEGNRTPQIAFLTPFGDPSRVVQKVYNDLYGKGLYRDLWFQWKGKPLIMADPAKIADPQLRDFFTFRAPEPTYFEKPDTPDRWGWLDVYPQHAYKNSEGKIEQMTVGVGQNSIGAKRIGAFSQKNTTGRSWHDGRQDERPDAVQWGLNFAEQWKRALEVNPEFIFVTGWNEWIAMRLPEFAGNKEPVMFVDLFSQEDSRDVEPMKGGHTDNYYYQLIANIRRFKGTRPAPAAGGPQTIAIDGQFADWAPVPDNYRDTVGDTAHRNHPGWNNCGPYVNTSGRNDIVAAKVAYDEKNIYFYVQTKDKLTPATDPNWMWLLVDADANPATGWQGYDYLINQSRKGDGVTTIQKNVDNGWSWTEQAEVNYRAEGNELELAVPRLALSESAKTPRFDFKWADNTIAQGDVLDFILNGDTAPNDRYRYQFGAK